MATQNRRHVDEWLADVDGSSSSESHSAGAQDADAPRTEESSRNLQIRLQKSYEYFMISERNDLAGAGLIDTTAIDQEAESAGPACHCRIQHISVLFVCLGNICRSPMAEAVFRFLTASNPTFLKVDSAGIAVTIRQEPDFRTVEMLQRNGNK